MLIIRLQRKGRKNEPTFRIVVTDSKNSAKKNGKFLEVLGSYDARDKNVTNIDADKIKEYVANGAQISDTVRNILIDKGVVEGRKVNVLPKKSPVIDEEKLKAEAEAKEKAEAEAKAKAEAEAAAAAQPVEAPVESSETTSEKTETPAEVTQA